MKAKGWVVSTNKSWHRQTRNDVRSYTPFSTIKK